MKRVSEEWYQGTADAVYQNIYSIGSEQPQHVLILSGDHIYKMNYGRMLQAAQRILELTSRWRPFRLIPPKFFASAWWISTATIG